jgi:hypothetical protein
MSLGKIAPSDRALLKFHGWLLLAWSVCIGVLTSAFLLYVAHVHSMALRYAAASTVFYLGGFVFGGWWYVRWWRSRGDGGPRRASADDEMAYGQEQEAARKNLNWFDGLDWLSWGGGDDPISILLMIIAALVMLVLVTAIAWMLPGMATDALGGFLAELVVEFVIGAVLLRRLTRPKSMDEYWSHAFRNTWVAGAFLVALFTAAGFSMQRLNPEARTLVEFARGH